jgi:transcriptional regulator with XRE-family HTH domain
MAKSEKSETATFGKALRSCREKIKISQEELAHRAGLHRTYVGSVERGERNISLKNIYALAGSLQTTPSALLKLAESLAKYSR